MSIICCRAQNDENISARLVQQHIVSTTGKLVTLRDVHNIRRRLKKAEWSATVDELERFQQHDPNAMVDVLVRDGTNEFEMLVLQTAQMRENIRSFPEVIQLDGTYAVNSAALPLYALLVEDSSGCGRLGAVILTRGEAAVSLQTMLSCIREHNPDLSCTRIVIVDKDLADVEKVNSVLPEAEIQLCVHSMLEAVRAEIVNTVPKASQQRIYSMVHSLVHARSPAKFAECWGQLESHEPFAMYMATDWLPTKSWWVRYERACHVNLGNGTNDRIGGQFGRLKLAVGRSRLLNDCVRRLVAVLRMDDVQERYQSFSDAYASSRRSSVSSEVAGYFDVCTPYAVGQIADQLELACSERYMTWSDGESVTVTTVQSREQYVVAEGFSTCTCRFNRTMLLPCRHILLVRRQFEMSLVDADIVADRWKTSKSIAPSVAFQQLGGYGPESDQALSRSEKFNAAYKQLNRLCDAMSEIAMREFIGMTHFVEKVIELCEAGRECVLLDDVDVDDAVELVTPGYADASGPPPTSLEIDHGEWHDSVAVVVPKVEEELQELSSACTPCNDTVDPCPPATVVKTDLSLLRSVAMPLSLLQRRSPKGPKNSKFGSKTPRKRQLLDGGDDVGADAGSNEAEMHVTIDIPGGPVYFTTETVVDNVSLPSNGAWIQPSGWPKGAGHAASNRKQVKRKRAEATEEISSPGARNTGSSAAAWPTYFC